MQLDAVLPVLLANWNPLQCDYSNRIVCTACALLQTNSACRQAVQHAAACGAVFLSVKGCTELAQFSAWLPKHAGLITSIHISKMVEAKEPSLPGPAEPGSSTAAWPAAQHLLTTALQQSLDVSTASSSTAGRSHNVRITVFGSPCPTSPALFDALAAFSSLTRLSLPCSPGQPTPAVCDALGRLRSLEYLFLETAAKDDEAGRALTVVSPGLAAAMHQLQALTCLSLGPYIPPDQLWGLPSSLRMLYAHVAAEEVLEEEQEWVPPVRIDLQQLIQLTCLILSSSAPVSEDSLLPENLIHFYVRGPVNAHPGSNLQALNVPDPLNSLGLMRSLPNLPQLRTLTLDMGAWQDDDSWAGIVTVAAAIHQATQVCELKWDFMDLGLTAKDNAALATELQLGRLLAGLTHLGKLDLQLPAIPEPEVLQLTALTQLTELRLDYCGKGVTDVVVVALAARLRELRVLSLCNCGLQSPEAVLPALASLQSLCGLRIENPVQPGPGIGLQSHMIQGWW